MRQIHVRSLVCLLALLVAASVFAQPSGGPYGPILQPFPNPEAKRLFFVAPDGLPANSGASVDAPTSLDAAIERAETGDAILLRGGLYRTGGLHFNQGITIQAYQDESPVLMGTRIATDWQRVGDAVWRTDWDRLFPAAPADWWRAERHIDETPLHRFNYDQVFVDGRLLQNAGSIEELSPEHYYIDYENGWVCVAADPDIHQIEITAHDSALVRTMRRVHNRDNDRQGPTIRGLTFTRYARLALLVEGVEPGEPMDPQGFGKEVVGTTLEHLTITHCSRVAGYFRGDGLTIRHCLIADNGTEGLYVINSADILLERNIITRTNSQNRYAGYFASAIKIFNQSHRAVVRDNLVIDNPHASGIWYDVGNVDGVVINNWVERTADGFFFEISRGAICAGNVFVDCPAGVRILNSADVAVYQNTFYNSTLQVHRTPRSSEAGDHFGWHAAAGPDVDQRHGHVVHNNLFVAEQTFPAGLVQIWQTPQMAAVADRAQLEALDGNGYVTRAQDQKLVTRSETGWPPASPPEPKALLDDASGLEEQGAVFRGYRGPVFRSAELKRFELLRTFPGRNAGIPLPENVRSLLGWDKEPGSVPGAYPLE